MPICKDSNKSLAPSIRNLIMIDNVDDVPIEDILAEERKLELQRNHDVPAVPSRREKYVQCWKLFDEINQSNTEYEK